MKEHQPRYEITRYYDQGIFTDSLSQSELAKIDIKQVDHFLSNSLGLWAFHTADGNWIEHRGEWPGLGPVNLLILQALQINPGIFLQPRDIAALTGHDGLSHNGTLSAGILRLRRAHIEQGQPWFIETTKNHFYGLRWSPARSWMSIELIRGSLPGPRSQSTSESGAATQHVVRTV